MISDDQNVPPLQACISCGKPSGMPMIDVWSIPPGACASIVVTCAVCMAERERGKGWAKILSTRPDGEPPEQTDPDEGRIATVFVLRWRGAWAYTAIEDGAVLVQAGGFTTRGAAFDAGARAIVEAGARAHVDKLIDDALTADGTFRRVDDGGAR